MNIDVGVEVEPAEAFAVLGHLARLFRSETGHHPAKPLDGVRLHLHPVAGDGAQQLRLSAYAHTFSAASTIEEVTQRSLGAVDVS